MIGIPGFMGFGGDDTVCGGIGLIGFIHINHRVKLTAQG